MILAEEMLPRYAEWLMAAIRDLHSALFVLQELPGWQEKYAAAQANRLLNEKVDRMEELSRALVENALGHQEANPEFLALLDRLRKAMHEPLQ